MFFRLTKTLKERESWFEKQLQKKIGNYSKRSKFVRIYAVYYRVVFLTGPPLK